MTDRLPALTDADLSAIEKCPIIPLDVVYEDNCCVDYAFDNYVNIKLDSYSTAYIRERPPATVPNHRIMALCYSSIDNYMKTVEHPGFTNVPRTGKQFSWYKKYIKTPRTTDVTFDQPRLEHYIPPSFGISLGIGKEIDKSLRKSLKRITKKKTQR